MYEGWGVQGLLEGCGSRGFVSGLVVGWLYVGSRKGAYDLSSRIEGSQGVEGSGGGGGWEGFAV